MGIVRSMIEGLLKTGAKWVADFRRNQTQALRATISVLPNRLRLEYEIYDCDRGG